MRTTVTLDRDVAAKLKRLAGERRISFKEALNSAGAAVSRAEPSPRSSPRHRFGEGTAALGRIGRRGDPAQARAEEVKLPDLNLLLYALDEGTPLHSPAREWLEKALSGTEEVAFAWTVLLGFLRLTTNPSVFDEPLPVEEALEVMDGWLAQPVARVVHPTPQHAATLRRLLQPHGAAGNLVSDAHLAALAIEHDTELCSHDRDFGRFDGLRWHDPLD